MTYPAIESSRQSGRPVFLYRMVQGSLVWLFTTAARVIEFGGEDYKPSSVSSTELKQSSEMAKDGIRLTFPRTDEFASQFLGYSPDLVTTVTVFRLHTSDPDSEAIVYWKGRVASSKAAGARIELECESIFTSLRRPGLRARYQRSCRHALYGRGCRLDPEAFAVPGTLTAISANAVTVTVPEAATYEDGWFFGGMLRASDGALRLIVGHSGSTITLSRPLARLAQDLALAGYGNDYGNQYGSPVCKLYPGCDHSTATCLGKFDNLDNHGGFPFIPLKNPFGGSSIV